MKRLYPLIAATIFTIVVSKAHAQNNNNNNNNNSGNGNGFDQLIKSRPADATILICSFAEPLFIGFGVGLIIGWNKQYITKNLFLLDLHSSPIFTSHPSHDQTLYIH